MVQFVSVVILAHQHLNKSSLDMLVFEVLTKF